MLLTLPWSWSIRACMRSWFFLSSSPAKVSSLIVRSDLRRFLQISPLRLLSASNSDSNSLMRVSILIMALRPPFSALTSASSARAPASLHWASRSFLSFSRFIATSCSQRSSSASLAASTIALAALSSESLASLLISSKSAPSWLNSDSSFLFAAAIDWLTFQGLQVSHWCQQVLVRLNVSGDLQFPTKHGFPSCRYICCCSCNHLCCCSCCCCCSRCYLCRCSRCCCCSCCHLCCCSRCYLCRCSRCCCCCSSDCCCSLHCW